MLKNKIEFIKNTWTWNHKMLILNITLIVVVLFQAGFIPVPEIKAAEPISYTKSETVTEATIQDKLEKRAIELHEANKSMDLERYRQEAIIEMKDELIVLIGESPFVDYEALSEKYGY